MDDFKEFSIRIILGFSASEDVRQTVTTSLKFSGEDAPTAASREFLYLEPVGQPDVKDSSYRFALIGICSNTLFGALCGEQETVLSKLSLLVHCDISIQLWDTEDDRCYAVTVHDGTTRCLGEIKDLANSNEEIFRALGACRSIDLKGEKVEEVGRNEDVEGVQ